MVISTILSNHTHNYKHINLSYSFLCIPYPLYCTINRVWEIPELMIPLGQTLVLCTKQILSTMWRQYDLEASIFQHSKLVTKVSNKFSKYTLNNTFLWSMLKYLCLCLSGGFSRQLNLFNKLSFIIFAFDKGANTNYSSLITTLSDLHPVILYAQSPLRYS